MPKFLRKKIFHWHAVGAFSTDGILFDEEIAINQRLIRARKMLRYSAPIFFAVSLFSYLSVLQLLPSSLDHILC